MRCYKTILGIFYGDRIINDAVRDNIRPETGPLEDLITRAKKKKLKWHGNVIRARNLSTAILKVTALGERENVSEKMGWKRHLLNWKILDRDSNIGMQQRHIEGADQVLIDSTKTSGYGTDNEDDVISFGWKKYFNPKLTTSGI